MVTSTRRMDGKVVVITGANSGLGREAAKDLAGRGATVVLACRDLQAAQLARDHIRAHTDQGILEILHLDLSDLESVREFAAELKLKFNRLDVLMNNAGVWVPNEQRRTTRQGAEIHMGVNHFGHFLLTHLLQDLCTTTPNSRIVLVSSVLGFKGCLNFDDINSELGYDKSIKSPNILYSHSKLANFLHAHALQSRVKGTGTSVFCLCPGLVNTGLTRNVTANMSIWQYLRFCLFFWIAARTIPQGAKTLIHAAVSEELDGVDSGFLQDCALAALPDHAKDTEAAEKLWKISMDTVQEVHAQE
ncbi:unnamed protein product [Meganyctiphanes norvegica]|uniref:Retinol dehydrogenase 11 n=1 Tax=Meganyctiphanes norvegica TaxID=48144 RepID=A0AAV2RJH7_MEGNR